jgi:radical SAM protein with 4Fe4S-binding SPASM domain
MKKLSNINIDPNGICNAKCWFCPVAYMGNSKENKTNMSIETMEDIFKQLDAGRGIWVEEKIQNFPIHFNEVLLYPYFKEMLDLHRKYNIKVSLFSNGVNLTKDKTDLITEYRDIVDEVLLNVPSLNEKQWSEFSGFNIKIFPKLIENLKYAEEHLCKIFSPDQFYIMANGVNEKSLFKNGGWLEVLNKAPQYDLDLNSGTLAQIVEEMKTILPNVNIWGRNNLGDRVGILEKFNIISNQDAIKEKNSGRVIGCANNYTDALFVSATGNIFICSADFDYETVYINIKDKPLKEIWEGSERKEAIKKAYEGICTTCFRAIKETGSGPSIGRVI